VVRADGTMVDVNGMAARRLKALLASLPVASIGHGVNMYTFSSSLCPVCLGMDRQYPGAITNIRTHYLAVPLAPQENAAVLQVWRDPTIANYRRYMRGAYRSLPYLVADSRTEGSDAFRRTSAKICEIQEIFVQHSGSSDPNIASGTPRQIVPFENDKVLLIVGQAWEIVASLIRFPGSMIIS
jgi:hypothetical protein